MPFEYILADLLAKNENALGAMFVDDNGESVDVVCTDSSPNDMKVIGAYVGIHLRQLYRFVPEETFGELRLMHFENRGLHLYCSPLPEGYFLVLAQRGPSLSFRGRQSVAEATTQLKRELFGDDLG